MTPGDRLRAARIAAGLTQAEAAARMPGKVSARRWSDMENGQRVPSLEWLWDAAMALGVDPSGLDERLAARKPGK
jgi:transcriptional regulator with XRE-family HTH domain